jgi:hypothetical protein
MTGKPSLCKRQPRVLLLAALLAGAALLPGCAVVAVVDTAASLAIGTVGLVGDAAIGTVRVAGKVVGAAADAVLPGGK